MRKLLFLGSLCLVALVSAPAGAATPVKRTMTCPIGGERFDYGATPSQTGTGNRPDGRPYGVAAAPTALPECPGNGLVLYKDYTPEEVAKLTPLISGDEYSALRKGDTQYYRAYWLMRQMGLGPEDYLWALLEASWEAEGKPELRSRYLGELADASAKVPAAPSDMNWIGMEARSINALRELGRFDEASARLAKVPLQGLDVKVPDGKGLSDPAMLNARTKRGWLTFFQGLKAAIARKDASPEPFDLIPRSVALGYCIERPGLDEQQKGFCESEKPAVEEMRLARAKAADELRALSGSRDASGR